MAGIRLGDKRLTRQLTVDRNVPYLFQVRNMFFCVRVNAGSFPTAMIYLKVFSPLEQ